MVTPFSVNSESDGAFSTGAILGFKLPCAWSALEQRLRETEGDESAAVVKATRPSAAQKERAVQAERAAQQVVEQTVEDSDYEEGE